MEIPALLVITNTPGGEDSQLGDCNKLPRTSLCVCVFGTSIVVKVFILVVLFRGYAANREWSSTNSTWTSGHGISSCRRCRVSSDIMVVHEMKILLSVCKCCSSN